ncbi:MAG: DUF3823 domain-containing protein [Bacteroides sp.]
MKKGLYSLLIGASVTMATSCMEVDNFDAPDAHLTGRIIDATTGENMLADQGECRVRIWEKSYSTNPGNQDIPVKQDGSYNNDKLFKGTYDMVPEGAWWPADTIRVGLGNKLTQNFEVTPYLKLFDFQLELTDPDSIRVSCRFEAPIGEGLPTIMDIRPFLSMNQFCGAANCISYYSSQDQYKKSINKTWAKLEKESDGKSLTYSFKVWVKKGYVYFVRMGARVKDTFQKYNYTEIKEIEIPQ